MEIRRLEIVDWEPCVLRFIFRKGQIPSKEFRRFVEGWLKALLRPGCGCTFRYAEFSGSAESHEETLRSEWLCERCVESLVKAVGQKFPALDGVELGLRHQPVGKSLMIDVASKQVELEDHTQVRVSAFSIGKRPVTIGEFESFVRATAYVTEAEKQRSADTFRNHCGLSGLAESVQKEVPAQFVTLADAEAYCRHTKTRLPTEAEWLAAAVLNQAEIEMTGLEELQQRARPVPPNALEVNNWDITATRVSGDMVVARRGPVHFLKKGWREPLLLNFNRRLIRTHQFDMSITFRICR